MSFLLALSFALTHYQLSLEKMKLKQLNIEIEKHNRMIIRHNELYHKSHPTLSQEELLQLLKELAEKNKKPSA